MQQTTNYKLNRVEREDFVKESIEALGKNAEKIDKLFLDFQGKLDRAENILPTTTASGENVYIDNAVNYPLIGLSGEGKCEQAGEPSPDNPQEITTMQSYNFLDTNAFESFEKNGISFVKNSDGTAKINGTCTAGFGMQFPINMTLKPGTYLYCKQDIGINYFTLSLRVNSVTYSDATLSGGKVYKEFTLEEETTFNEIGIWIDSGVTFNNYILKLMVIEGTELKPYLPHDSLLYKGVKKNLIDLTQINSTSAQIKLSASGCTISDKNINSMVLTAVGTWSNAYLDFQENYFKENEDIVVSSKFLETISGRTSQVGYTVYGSDDGSTYSVIKSDTAHEIKYNVSTKISTSINVGTYKYIRARIWANANATSITSGESVINISELMVARGTDDTYEPYQEVTLPIDLQGNELCKVGDVADKLLIDRKGNVAIEKNVSKTILNGSERWISTTAYEGFYRYILNMTNLVGATSPVSGMNTHFIQRINQAHGAYEYLFVQKSANGGTIFIQSKNLATVEELKAWLQQNNVTVYYQTTISEIINLGTIKNPEIFKGVNNIVVETNLGNMNVEIEYVEDLQARLEKVEQAIISLGGI